MKKALIHLRKIQMSDAARIAQLVNNRKIWDNVRDYLPHPYTEEDGREFAAHATRQDPIVEFAIIYAGELVGICGVKPFDDVYIKTGEIGFWIGEPYWNKGIASAAVAQIVEYGFSSLGLKRLQAEVFSFNKGSMHVLLKNGFVLEGVLRSKVFKNKKILDAHLFAKINPADC